MVTVLFAMGVPIQWKVSPVPLHGTVRPTSVIADFPVLLVATAVVAVGAIVAGLLAARARDRDAKGLLASGASFALLVGAASVAVSHARPMTLSRGVRADLNVSPWVAVAVGAGWAMMGTLVGVALHRRVAQRLSGRLVQAARTPVASGLVANLARPGGNLTGFTNYVPSMAGKWPREASAAMISTALMPMIMCKACAAVMIQ